MSSDFSSVAILAVVLRVHFSPVIGSPAGAAKLLLQVCILAAYPDQLDHLLSELRRILSLLACHFEHLS